MYLAARAPRASTPFLFAPPLERRSAATARRWSKALDGDDRAMSSPIVSSDDVFTALGALAIAESSVRFAYAWVAFGYVAPSALAIAARIDTTDAAALDEGAKTLSLILLSLESAKAAVAVDAIERAGVSAAFQLDVRGLSRGAAYGACAAVLARVIDRALVGVSESGASSAGAASFIASGDVAATAATALASCAVAPYLEELFFRHFLLRTLQAKTQSRVLAIAISSALFAAAHFSAKDFPSLFACGVVFAASASAPSNYAVSTVAHATYNASVLLESIYTHSSRA